jgi:hypothetical protein
MSERYQIFSDWRNKVMEFAYISGSDLNLAVSSVLQRTGICGFIGPKT